MTSIVNYIKNIVNLSILGHEYEPLNPARLYPCCALLHRPLDCKQRYGLGLLREPSFERIDQPVAFLHDLIFGLEDVLPLPALLFLQLPDLLLNFVLLIQRGRLTGQTAQGLDSAPWCL